MNTDTSIIDVLRKFIRTITNNKISKNDCRISIGMDEKTYEDFTIRLNKEIKIHLGKHGISLMESESFIDRSKEPEYIFAGEGKVNFYQLPNNE